MADGKSSLLGFGSFDGFFIVLFAALGFFAYHSSLTGLVVGALLTILQSLAALVGFVPIAGPILYYVFLGQWVQNWTLATAGVGPTWVTGWIFWYGLISSVIATAISSAFFLMWVKKS